MVLNLFVVSVHTRSERRIDPNLTVEQLKGKLETVTGIPAQNQQITAFNSEEDPQILAKLDEDSKLVGSYGLRDLQVLKVDDLNPSASFTGQLSDFSQVEKFELSDEAYAQRQDSVLVYKQRHQVGRFAPKDASPSDAKPALQVNIPLGSRCEVESAEAGLSKRGTVRFVGQTKFGTAEGTWVGIEYDEPFGKNDGSVQGVRYFTCQPKYGVFVRPEKVTIGNFPPVDILDDDEEM